jgi:hypothetical protein
MALSKNRDGEIAYLCNTPVYTGNIDIDARSAVMALHIINKFIPNMARRQIRAAEVVRYYCGAKPPKDVESFLMEIVLGWVEFGPGYLFGGTANDLPYLVMDELVISEQSKGEK